MCQRTDPFTVIIDNRPHNEIQGQILEVAAYENIIHEQNVQHTDSDHKSEVIERSLTSTSSLVVSESEERHDRHNGSVFDNDEATVIDNDEATVIDAVTNQSTTASSLTENRDSEDVDTFDSIVSRGIGEREDDLRDDISDLSTDDTLRILQQRKTLLKQRWEVMLRMFVKVQLRKGHVAPILLTSATIDLTRIMMTMKSLIHRFTILWNGIWEILY